MSIKILRVRPFPNIVMILGIFIIDNLSCAPIKLNRVEILAWIRLAEFWNFQ